MVLPQVHKLFVLTMTWAGNLSIFYELRKPVMRGHMTNISDSGDKNSESFPSPSSSTLQGWNYHWGWRDMNRDETIKPFPTPSLAPNFPTLEALIATLQVALVCIQLAASEHTMVYPLVLLFPH